jgi:valyl-tRNA synthetase
MNLSSQYTPQEIESKWYEHWLEHNYFHSEPDEREAFSIVIPPPNVTGVLHMGHMLNNTIQDILIRKARLDGKNACWVPGTDHASIATEAKVVKMLREQGIKKSDLTREEFLGRAYEWKDKYGGIILKQLRKLGASCDWERTAFTMDESRSKAVLKAFVDLYNSDKLYRKKRMVNWDPEAKTVLSNEEVLYAEEQSNLYHVKYMIEGGDGEFITVATTRPETIMGDSAVAVHPDDPRYSHLKGKKVIVPLVNRAVPIIFDDYVTMDFGTGALKVTPAHDVNDHEIGQRHNLEVIDIFNDDGTLSEAAQIHVGVDRFDARRLVKDDLKGVDLLIKIESHMHNVGRSERTSAVVEPKLSLQWYVDMEALAKPALDAVMSDEVEFFPKNQKNLYSHWMTNIRDWCISRQLWWGHQIPAWYYEDKIFVANTAEEALQQAHEQTGNKSLTIRDLRQDEDVLDTWFSSWLWPISVFDGFESREELDYYYPTSVLVTGWDIIFLWVARMVMAGYEWEQKRPFDHVYFTGMVRDNQRRKMSKSLGNSPDALELIDTYGADGVRFGMLSSSPAGGDLLFETKLCEQGRNFCNKMWNALRLVKGWSTHDNAASEVENLAIRWIETKLQAVTAQVEQNYKEYRLSEALTALYSFVWNDFCSWYLEMIKPEKDGQLSQAAVDVTINVYEQICQVLHPFMPFITEEIWHQLRDRQDGEDCVVSTYPKADALSSDDKAFLAHIDSMQDIISQVRALRNKNGIKMKEPLDLTAVTSKGTDALFAVDGLTAAASKMAVLSSFTQGTSETEGLLFIGGADQFILQVDLDIDTEAELAEKEKELVYQQGFVKSIMGKLGNERFVNNAPQQVVANERKKLADGEARITILQEEIGRLKS